jgi:hypothetical protein
MYYIACQKIRGPKADQRYKNNCDDKAETGNREIENPINFDKDPVNDRDRYDQRNKEKKSLQEILAKSFHDSTPFLLLINAIITKQY